MLYLDGGWQTIVDGLLDAALAAGVEIATGAKAERVERQANGTVRGLRTADGQLVYASNKSGKWDIYVMAANGSGSPVDLTAGSGANNWNPRWSPGPSATKSSSSFRRS